MLLDCEQVSKDNLKKDIKGKSRFEDLYSDAKNKLVESFEDLYSDAKIKLVESEKQIATFRTDI